MKKPISVETSFARWRRDPAYLTAYESLEGEYAVAAALIEARTSAGLSQEDVAERMRTSQSTVARLEGGKANMSMQTLRRFAAATGTRLRISFERDGSSGSSRPDSTRARRARPDRRH